MKYKILCVGDVHWGCMDAVKQYEELRILPEYLENHEIDLLVFCGDYFDHKLMLNSEASLLSLKFMNDMRMLSRNEKHPFKIRIFTGTRSHDYDQLRAFDSFDDGDTFRVFDKTTAEETLPGLKCLYAPDETMTNEDYFIEYEDILAKQYDIMFFHGSFDVQLGDLILNSDEPHKNVIFEYDYFSQICMVMIGGHWHDSDHYSNMWYTRSMNRWTFGEDEPKGFIECTYDTKMKTYEIDRISNPYTDRYVTYIVDTSLYTDMDKYNSLMNAVSAEIENDKNVHIKLKVNVTNESDMNKIFIDNLRYKYANTKSVKLVVENKLIKKKRKEKEETHNIEKDTYHFLFDPNVSMCDKICEFIKVTKGIELSQWQVEMIKGYLLSDKKISEHNEVK